MQIFNLDVLYCFQGNNDDIILSCCLHYCKDMARDYMPKGKGTLCNGAWKPL